MTRLTIYTDSAPHGVLADTRDFAAIARELAGLGVALERWEAKADLSAVADDEAMIAAYEADVARLQARGGYRSRDVVSLTADHPQAAAMRAKFLAEHTHSDDEVRFFVEGSGLFYIRARGRVHALECTAGDLIVLPAGTRHWFDTGARPHFTAIRLFTSPQGWVAEYTGDEIAGAIPQYEPAA